MLIGDSKGITGIFNVFNGAKIKNLPKHQGEVSHIVHCSQKPNGYQEEGKNFKN